MGLFERITKLSAKKIASSISEVTKMLVFWFSSKSSRKNSCIKLRDIASRPRKGSSIIITVGSFIRALANSARLCMPPESWIGNLFINSPSPTLINKSSASLCKDAPLFSPRIFGPKVTFSIVVCHGMRAVS